MGHRSDWLAVRVGHYLSLAPISWFPFADSSEIVNDVRHTDISRGPELEETHV